MNRYLWISIKCGCLQVGQPDVILTNISVHETITICRLEDNILNIYYLLSCHPPSYGARELREL